MTRKRTRSGETRPVTNLAVVEELEEVERRLGEVVGRRCRLGREEREVLERMGAAIAARLGGT